MKTVAQLVSRRKCEDKHCPNYTKVCFVKDKAHYLFSNEQNSVWAAAMIAGTHTVDAPPSELQGSVMTPRVGRSKASTMLATIPPAAPTNINYNFYGESTMPADFHFPSRHRSAFAGGLHVQPQVQSQGPQESSPVGSDLDPGERVDSYLTWLSKHKLPAADLAHVDGLREKFRDESLDLEGIRKMSTAQLVSITGVPYGMAQRIGRYVKQFVTQEKLGAAADS
jgi:hypothetical protein